MYKARANSINPSNQPISIFKHTLEQEAEGFSTEEKIAVTGYLQEKYNAIPWHGRTPWVSGWKDRYRDYDLKLGLCVCSLFLFAVYPCGTSDIEIERTGVRCTKS